MTPSANGRSREAAEELERARKQDPLAVSVRTHLGNSLLAAGREAEAEAEFRQILELDERFWPARMNMIMIHALRGELVEALAYAEKAYTAAPGFPQAIGLLAGVLALSGDTGRAEAILEKLRPGQAYGAPRALALYHLLCGEVEKAADWTGKAIQQRDPLMMLFLRYPVGKPLRSSARWPALAKMMNLPGTT